MGGGLATPSPEVSSEAAHSVPAATPPPSCLHVLWIYFYEGRDIVTVCNTLFGPAVCAKRLYILRRPSRFFGVRKRGKNGRAHNHTQRKMLAC